jgi:hypothetical protein
MDSNHDDSREDCLGMELVSNIEKIDKEILVSPIAAYLLEIGHLTVDGIPDSMESHSKQFR